MLKRYQVLLPDWLENYIIQIAELFDLSFSEIIRLELCFSILSSTKSFYPKYKMGITPKEILESAHGQKDVKEEEEKHRFMSKIYFETRKAVEYRLPILKKQKRK